MLSSAACVPWILEGTMDNREDLTRAERRFLERAAEAQEQGLTLEEYYRASGLSVGWLHNIRRQLQGKGVVVPEPTARGVTVPSGKFLEVCVAPTMRSQGSAVCRLRHPSGWMIECLSWPPGSWLAECFGGASHAAA
jgi:hypothetical protein